VTDQPVIVVKSPDLFLQNVIVPIAIDSNMTTEVLDCNKTCNISIFDSSEEKLSTYIENIENDIKISNSSV
jgi:hypothetical protein